jgi:hypothetical protein
MSPEDYAEAWTADLRVAEMSRDRSQQTQQRILGVSDIAGCRSYGARFLAGDPFTDADVSQAALRGTWIHNAVLPIISGDGLAGYREHEVRLDVTLPNGQVVRGHGDLLDWEEPSATDLKTANGLAGPKRHGADRQQRMQRHLYGAGMVQSGRGGKLPGLVVRNVWMNRNDLLEPPHVEQEPYDPTWLDPAATWVDEVQYHVDQGPEGIANAPRDRDVFWCRQFCPFVTACRGPETVAVDEVIQSDELAVAAAMQREAIAMEEEAKEIRRAARQVLERVQDAKVLVKGEAGTFRVASTWVNPSSYEVNRAGYFKTDVKEVK